MIPDIFTTPAGELTLIEIGFAVLVVAAALLVMVVIFLLLVSPLFRD